MSLPVKKIYVDSRYKTNDSVSTSNFKFQLPRNVFLPQNTVFYLEDVCIPHSWYTVEPGFNDTLYVYYQSTGANNGIWVLTIPADNYTGTTLAGQIQTLLKTNIDNNFTASYGINRNNITISLTTSTVKFKILSDDELILGGVASAYPLHNTTAINFNMLNSCNDLIGNTNTSTTVCDSTNPFTSGMLDLLSIRNIFISSPNLGSFSTMGARGESNIIKKVPVSSDFGYLIIDSFTSPHDFLDCSKLTLGTIEFALRDVKGNYIPLHGGHVSFSIVFSAVNMDT